MGNIANVKSVQYFTFRGWTFAFFVANKWSPKKILDKIFILDPIIATFIPLKV